MPLIESLDNLRLGLKSHFHVIRFLFSAFTSHVIKTKNRNHSMNKVKNLEYDR